MSVSHSRSDVAFFHDIATKHQIEEIADSDDLVIFAGAGVTIDRTGLNWRGLLKGLLKKVASSEIELEAILSYVGSRSELHFASVVRSMYERTGPAWNRRMIEDTHALLYSERTWRGGRYANAIARLVLSARAAGRRVCVVTTNQDQFIEIALGEALEQFGETADVSMLSLELKETAGKPVLVDHEFARPTAAGEPIRVIHVHGAIKKDPRRDSKIGSIVLGERDFFNWEQRVADLLVSLFTAANVLIVGAGLEDANLLRALHRIKAPQSSRSTEKKIWYILTKSDLVQKPISEAGVNSAKVGLSKRLAEFGITPILPDMYSQAHQVLLEVAQELTNSTENCRYSDEDAEYRYGQRLRGWWQAWDAETRTARRNGMNVLQRMLATQAEHHALLTGVESSVRAELSKIPGYRKNDRVKVELWLRWNPSDTNRVLRLWSSSLGAWASESGFKDEEIVTDAATAAVRSFSSGSAELVENDSRRWQRYLAVPVEVSAGGSSVIVGSVTVAVSNPALLRWKEVLPMRQLVHMLPEWCNPLVRAGSYEVVPVGLPTS